MVPTSCHAGSLRCLNEVVGMASICYHMSTEREFDIRVIIRSFLTTYGSHRSQCSCCNPFSEQFPNPYQNIIHQNIFFPSKIYLGQQNYRKYRLTPKILSAAFLSCRVLFLSYYQFVLMRVNWFIFQEIYDQKYCKLQIKICDDT